MRSRPLAEAKSQGKWPLAFESFFAGLKKRSGQTDGAKQMIEVLMLLREYDSKDVITSVARAIDHGAYSAEAVAILLRQLHQACEDISPLEDLGELARFERPITDINDYDQLLEVIS